MIIFFFGRSATCSFFLFFLSSLPSCSQARTKIVPIVTAARTVLETGRNYYSVAKKLCLQPGEGLNLELMSSHSKAMVENLRHLFKEVK